MNKTFKNAEMVGMMQSLKPILNRRDKIGYVAARNYRILDNTLTEYKAFRNDLIKKYGEDDGHGSIEIKMDSPNFEIFMKELEPLNNMEHEVDLMTAKFEEAIGSLSGEEILSIDWMLND